MRPGSVCNRDRLAVLGIFGLALVARLWQLVHTERRGVMEGYDPATYYTAAAALLHGRLPYHGDFTFMHPPVIVLAGLPSALLGALTTAHTGYVAAHVLCCLLGALTCAGVTVIARQWGLGRGPAVLGGAFLAVSPVIVLAQSVFRLEPIGDVLLVVALVVLGAGPEVSRRRLVIAGVVFGVLVNVKLWWFLPVLLLVALTAVRVRSWAVVAVPAAVAAVTAAVIDLPFLLVPGSRMFHALVVAQLHRPAMQATPNGLNERMSTLTRLDQATGALVTAQRFLSPAQAFDDARVHAATITLCVAFLVAAALALRSPLGRLAVPLFLAQVAAVLMVPVYFGYYGDFVGVPAALVLAAAAAALPAVGRWTLAVLPLAAAVALLLVVTAPDVPGGTPLPEPDRIAAAVGDARCVISDSPGVLIAVDAVGRSLSPGCRNWVDIQGVEHGAGPDPRVKVIAYSPAIRAWRRAATRYFSSADVLVLSDAYVRATLGTRRYSALVRDRQATRVHAVVVYGPRLVR